MHRERPLDDKQKAQQQQQQVAAGGSARSGPSRLSTAASWRHANVLSRPRRAMFVGLVRALLAAADHATLARLLPLRPLLGGLLHHLAADPPAEALDTLAVLARRVLAPPPGAQQGRGGPGGGAGAGAGGLPPRLRAEPFGDSALAALADVAGSSDDPVAGAGAEQAAEAAEEGKGEEEEGEEGAQAGGATVTAATVAEAALEVLVMLCTDPANGLVTHGPGGGAVAGSSGDAGAAAAADAGLDPDAGRQHGPGVKRVLRLFPRLRPLERSRHGRLLVEVAARRPWLAAEFASSLPYDLQPRVGGREGKRGEQGRADGRGSESGQREFCRVSLCQ